MLHHRNKSARNLCLCAVCVALSLSRPNDSNLRLICPQLVPLQRRVRTQRMASAGTLTPSSYTTRSQLVQYITINQAAVTTLTQCSCCNTNHLLHLNILSLSNHINLSLQAAPANITNASTNLHAQINTQTHTSSTATQQQLSPYSRSFDCSLELIGGRLLAHEIQTEIPRQKLRGKSQEAAPACNWTPSC